MRVTTSAAFAFSAAVSERWNGAQRASSIRPPAVVATEAADQMPSRSVQALRSVFLAHALMLLSTFPRRQPDSGLVACFQPE
jgi:hypothetical protein